MMQGSFFSPPKAVKYFVSKRHSEWKTLTKIFYAGSDEKFQLRITVLKINGYDIPASRFRSIDFMR